MDKEMTNEETVAKFFKDFLLEDQLWYLPGDDPFNKEAKTTTAFYKCSYKQLMILRANRQIWKNEEEKVKKQLHLSEEEYW